MPQVKLNTASPPFTLQTYQGETFSLEDLKEKSNVLLVFNRGFF